MLTFNKLEEIMDKLDPGIKDLGFVVSMMDENGNTIGFRALSANIVTLVNMREIAEGGQSVGNGVQVIILGPEDFILEDHISAEKILTYYKKR